MSTLALAYLFGLPLTGTVIAIAAIFYSYESANRAKPTSGLSNRTPSRLFILLILPTFLVVLGVVLWLLSQDKATGAMTSSIVESAAMAYGIPSLLSDIGIGIVFLRGVGKTIQDDKLFSRVLVYVMHPLTAAIFGLVISFLILGQIPPFSIAPIVPPIPETIVNSASTGAIYISIGGIGAPLSAILSTSYKDAWHPAGMGRALIRSTIGESVCMVFLLLAFLTINA